MSGQYIHILILPFSVIFCLFVCLSLELEVMSANHSGRVGAGCDSDPCQGLAGK